MKPSRTSIRDLMMQSVSAVDFKSLCKSSFGWSDKVFFNYMVTNHTFNALKNKKSKDWILKEVFN